MLDDVTRAQKQRKAAVIAHAAMLHCEYGALFAPHRDAPIIGLYESSAVFLQKVAAQLYAQARGEDVDRT